MDVGVLSGQMDGLDLDRCDGVRIDVSGNCNLRCPYCINDFDQVQGNVLITEELFDRALTLLPLLRSGGHILFSCFFEPTLHPGFLDLLERVPEDSRRQAGFTTNLAKRLPDGFFAQLGRLGLGYVNVSLDSLTPVIFEEMRKPARFEVFCSNLQRLADCLNSGAAQTELHLITMVSKRNLLEIPDLVSECQRLYGPARHEVRTIWMTDEISRRPWVVEQAPSLDPLLELRRRLLNGCSAKVDFVLDLPENPEAFSPYPDRLPVSAPGSARPLVDPVSEILQAPPVPPIVQVNSQGSLRFMMTGGPPVLDLKDHPRPLETVKRMLELQNIAFGRAHLLREAGRQVRQLKRLNQVNQWLAEGRLDFNGGAGRVSGRLDEVKKVKGCYQASGWARKGDRSQPADEVVLIVERGKSRWAVGSTIPDAQRLDVADHFSDSRLLYTGWVASLHLDEELARDLPARIRLAAYAVDMDERVARKLDGECNVVLD